MKIFNVRDGHGIKMLVKAGIKVAIITGRHSKVVERRAHELGITEVYQRCHIKTVAYDHVIEKFGLTAPEADLSEWHSVVDAQLHPERRIRIAIVGKYLDLLDAYKSLSEAIVHAGIRTVFLRSASAHHRRWAASVHADPVQARPRGSVR